MQSCDVLIIGAGPGGGTAALHAAKAGLSVKIVEADPAVGTPVHCGECLSLEAVKNLGIDLPSEVIALEVDGVRVIFPDGTARLLTEPGFVLEKHLFERWICDEAEERGAELLLNHRVKSLERKYNTENKFSNWIVDGKGDRFPIECRAVIDASGVSGIASKLLDIGGEIEVIAGLQYEMHKVENDGYLDFYIWPEYSPEGYVWMIPKDEGRANVGLVTTDKKGAVNHLNRFIKDTYLKENPKENPPWRSNDEKIKPFGGTIPISGPRSITYGDGLLLIGDAAGFTSPLFEGGSHLAMWSGREAALTIKSAISENDLSSTRLSEYEKSWKRKFPPYSRILRGKKALYALSDNDLSLMARLLPTELGNMSILQKLFIGLKILVRKPTLYTKRIISVLLSFGYSRAKHFGW